MCRSKATFAHSHTKSRSLVCSLLEFEPAICTDLDAATVASLGCLGVAINLPARVDVTPTLPKRSQNGAHDLILTVITDYDNKDEIEDAPISEETMGLPAQSSAIENQLQWWSSYLPASDSIDATCARIAVHRVGHHTETGFRGSL